MIDVAYLPIPCMHCDNAPCIKAGSDGAITKREDGIVIIDPEKAKRVRKENPPEEDDVCTMCGKYCAIKQVKEFFES